MNRQRLADRIEDAMAALHYCGATLTGNTQGSDLEWLARVLFDASNLGAGDVQTIPWLLRRDEWEFVGLQHQQLMGDGPRTWEQLTEPQREAWRKLGRICLWVLPSFAERVGDRFMEQARALEAVWRQEREKGGAT